MNCLKKLPLSVATLCLIFCLRTSGFADDQSLSVDFKRGQYFNEPFFSFAYDGKSSNELLPQWKRERSSRKIDNQTTEQRIVWTDPATGLEVRCLGIEYQDFQAIEWTVYFENTGKENTPILKDIQGLDLSFKLEQDGEFVLNGTKGDWCTADSFEPFRQTLGKKATKRFVSFGGRPTNAAFPYYNLQTPGGGVFLAIGWPGQWASSFVSDGDRGLHIMAGQELTRLSLKPGEEIRSPLIAMLMRDYVWIQTEMFTWPTRPITVFARFHLIRVGLVLLIAGSCRTLAIWELIPKQTLIMTG